MSAALLLPMLLLLTNIAGGFCDPTTQLAAAAAHDDHYVPRQVFLEVLSSFKQSLIDPLRSLASWDSSNLSTNPCSGSWVGLQCSSAIGPDNSTIVITNVIIHLRNKSLQGSITPQLSGLSPVLTSLDLSYNTLTGPLTFLSNFSSLNSALQDLTLDYNHLLGPFTLPFSCLPHLVLLSIAENSISGRIPSESLTRCPSLQSLNLSNNLFIGPFFSSGLENLTTLVQLDAGRNNFSGPIPPSIGNCSKLTFLSLTYNKFSGHVPSSIGR